MLQFARRFGIGLPNQSLKSLAQIFDRLDVARLAVRGTKPVLHPPLQRPDVALPEHSNGSPGHSHRHDSAVGTLTLRSTELFDLARLERWLGDLLWEPSDASDIYRMKGVLNIAGKEEKHLLQVRVRLWTSLEFRVSRGLVVNVSRLEATSFLKHSDAWIYTGRDY